MDMQKAAVGLVELGAAALAAQRAFPERAERHRDVLTGMGHVDWDLLRAAGKSGTALAPYMMELADQASAELGLAIAAFGTDALEWSDAALGLPTGTVTQLRALNSIREALQEWAKQGWKLADRLAAGAQIGVMLDERARAHARARTSSGQVANNS